jgi:galactose mutarotase-like enzyme
MKRLETEWQEQPLFQITLSNDQMQVDVLNFGAVLQRISWAGQDRNLCLGYPTAGTLSNQPWEIGGDRWTIRQSYQSGTGDDRRCFIQI